MSEGNINAEVADHLREHGSHETNKAERRRIEIVEILEAVLLAVVALATALSGFQAALWDGHSAKEYATSSRLRVEAQSKLLTSHQYLLYNSGNVDSWLQAKTSGNEELADLLENRFTPEYEVAFRAWLATDPLTNPDAPAGPRFMPEYHDPLLEEAETINEEASHEFDKAVESRVTAEKYVRVTVILAAVLFLIALGQRFSIRGVRWGVTAVAGVFLAYCFILIAVYPHLFL
jgi:hypothetical protein